MTELQALRLYGIFAIRLGLRSPFSKHERQCVHTDMQNVVKAKSNRLAGLEIAYWHVWDPPATSLSATGAARAIRQMWKKMEAVRKQRNLRRKGWKKVQP